MPPYGIRTLVRESDFVPEPFASACKLLDFGPGCKIRRLFFTEDPNTVWYFISIWNTLNMHVRIELETELLKADREFRKCKGIVPSENHKEWKSHFTFETSTSKRPIEGNAALIQEVGDVLTGFAIFDHLPGVADLLGE